MDVTAYGAPKANRGCATRSVVSTIHIRHAPTRIKRFAVIRPVKATTDDNTPPDAAVQQPAQTYAAANPLLEIEKQGELVGIYRLLSLIFCGLFAWQSYFPDHYLTSVFAACSNKISILGMVRIIGAGNLFASIVSTCLADEAGVSVCASKDVVRGDDLMCDTYERLNLGLASWGILSTISLFAGPIHPTLPAFIGLLLLSSSVIYLCMNTYLRFAGITLQQLPKRLGLAAREMLPNLVQYSSVNAFVYGAGTKLFAVLAFSAFTASMMVIKKGFLTESIGALGTTLLRQFSPALALLAFATYSLKLAAKQNKMSNMTFQTMNFALSFVCFVDLFVMWTWYKSGILVAVGAATTEMGWQSAMHLVTNSKIGAFMILFVVSLYNFATNVSFASSSSMNKRGGWRWRW